MGRIVRYIPMDVRRHFYTVWIDNSYIAEVCLLSGKFILFSGNGNVIANGEISELRSVCITRYNRSVLRFDKAERISASLASLRRHIRKENPALCSFIGVTNTSDYKRLSVKVKKTIMEE